MIIYVILLCVVVISGLILKPSSKRINKRIYMSLIFIMLALIAGLRTSNVGVDTDQFCTAFRRIGQHTLSVALDQERYEKGFIYLCYFLNKISKDPQILIFITSIFINFSVVRFIYKNSKDVIFSAFLYITLNFYFSYMNIMRQAIAIAILLFSFENLKKKKYIRYFLELIIATLFHSSAILGILYFIFEKFKYKKKYNKYIVFLVILTFVFGRNIINLLASYSPKLYGYLGTEFGVENYFGSLLSMLVSGAILFFGLNIINNKDEKELENLNMYFYQKMLIIGLIMDTLTMRINIFNRFTPYFSIFQIIWIPNIFYIMKKNKTTFLLVALIFLILYWVILMIYRPEWYGVIPYEMIKL